MITVFTIREINSRGKTVLSFLFFHIWENFSYEELYFYLDVEQLVDYFSFSVFYTSLTIKGVFGISLTHFPPVNPGINAQARKLQKSRSRVTSLFVDGSGEDVDGLGIWRSLSEMDLSAMGKEASRARQSALREDPDAEADKEVLRLGMEKEETESSDDNTTQYSIHPPFDFPYFLLLQGYSHRQVSETGREVMLV